MPWAIMDKVSHKFVCSTNWEHAHPLSSLSTDQAELFHDKQTGVEYAMSWGCYNEGTLTMLVNTDGTPKVYEGWKK